MILYEKAEIWGKSSETGNNKTDMPGHIGVRRESDCLPDRLGAQRESNCLPDRLGAQRESDRLPDKLGVQQEITDPPDVSKLENNPSESQMESGLFEMQEAASSDIENDDLKELEIKLDTPEAIQKLIKSHPEKAELWKSVMNALETLNNPDATDAEKRSATVKLSTLKGQFLEIAVKDFLIEKGLSVEAKQRTVESQNGGTRPDVIATNNTDQPISVFGITINPGETLSIECKCGGKSYLTQQLYGHIPNQLSGLIGYKMLLTTEDIRQVNKNLVQNTCQTYGATLAVLNIKASNIEQAIKEVSTV